LRVIFRPHGVINIWDERAEFETGEGCVAEDSQTALCDGLDLRRIEIRLGDENDWLVERTGVPTSAWGGPGTDRVETTGAGEVVEGGDPVDVDGIGDLLCGGPGNDWLTGGEKAQIAGGQGNDRMASAESQWMSGGPRDDWFGSNVCGRLVGGPGGNRNQRRSLRVSRRRGR